MATARPFSFDNFNDAKAPVATNGATPVAPPAAAPAFSAADLAAARAEGVIEGRRLAMETIAADEAEQLLKIADALCAMRAQTHAEIVTAEGEISALARAFIEEFAFGLAEAREIAAAGALLTRLIENSEDRRAVRLFINPISCERLEPRLRDAFTERGVNEFATLEADPALKPGEIRLVWRGGEIRRSRAEIRAAVAALFDPLTEEMEAGDERA